MNRKEDKVQTQGCVPSTNAGVQVQEKLLRERAKSILEILVQCHNIMDDLTGANTENVSNPVPNSKIPELQEQLRGIENYAGELNVRMQKLLEKI